MSQDPLVSRGVLRSEAHRSRAGNAAENRGTPSVGATRRHDDLGHGSQTLRRAGEFAVVEAVQGLAVGACRQVQGVGEVQSAAIQIERCHDAGALLPVDVRQTEQVCDDLGDILALEPIEGAKHPFELQQHGQGDEKTRILTDDRVGDRALLGGLGVARVVDVETREYVAIKGNHHQLPAWLGRRQTRTCSSAVIF